MHQRNAVRVFPLPVGARISVDSPLEIAGQPSVCAGVGASNEVRNHCCTAGWNLASTSEETTSLDLEGIGFGSVTAERLMPALDSIGRRGKRLLRTPHGPPRTSPPGARRSSQIPLISDSLNPSTLDSDPRHCNNSGQPGSFTRSIAKNRGDNCSVRCRLAPPADDSAS